MSAVISSSFGIYALSTTFSTIANYSLNPLFYSDARSLSFRSYTSFFSYVIWSLSVIVWEFLLVIRLRLGAFPRRGLTTGFSFAFLSIISLSLAFYSMAASNLVRSMATSACKLSIISFWRSSYLVSTGASYMLLY